jgi:hypothetical protein
MSQQHRRLAVGLAAAVLGTGVAISAAPAAMAALAPVPYTDARSTGTITLCDQLGNRVTTGKVTDAPFAWKLIGSTAPLYPYDQPGRTATLFAYQPRQGVDPPQWSGAQLTGSARYTSVKNPTAVATPRDPALTQFTLAYPPKWQGLVQLRLFQGGPGLPIQSLHYDTADLRVSGMTWTVVRGGSLPCSAGAARSEEDILLPSVHTPAPSSRATVAQPPVSSTGPTGAVSSGPGAAAGSMAPAASIDPGGSSSPRTLVLLAAGLLAAGLVAVGFLVGRSRGAS